MLFRSSSVYGPFIVPRYEDRPLQEGIKAQITSLGGVVLDAPGEDVYKRQIGIALGDMDLPLVDDRGTGSLKWDDLIPVSYTHLDVYKRQIHLRFDDLRAADPFFLL